MLCIMFHVISHGKPFHKSEGHSHTSVAVYLKLSSYVWSFMLWNDLLCHACFSKKIFYNLFLWKRSSHYIGCKMHPDRKFLFSSPWHSFILHLVFCFGPGDRGGFALTTLFISIFCPAVLFAESNPFLGHCHLLGFLHRWARFCAVAVAMLFIWRVILICIIEIDNFVIIHCYFG